MTSIGIIGAGIAGLHLGLLLRQHGIDTTIYSEWLPEQLRGGRLLNNIIRFEHTRARERTLGVNHWDALDTDTKGVEVYVGGAQPLAFRGELARPASYIDMRLYLPRLLADFAERGGAVVAGVVRPSDVAALSEHHDLLVVAAGRGSLLDLFPREAEHSPYNTPQRRLCLGFFSGLDYVPERGVAYVIAPGQGEIFQTATYSFDGKQSALLFEAIPGGAFDTITRLRYEDNPAHFDTSVLKLLRTYAPPIYRRIDPAQFGLTRPLDLLQGAITPTVRHGYAPLPNGKFALAIGDVRVVNDPLIAQGANTASHSAWVLGEAILAGHPFDESFCRMVSDRIWQYAAPVTAWSNAALQPPPPHLLALMVAASGNQQLADSFADGFNTPLETWELLQSSERVAALLASSEDRRRKTAA